MVLFRKPKYSIIKFAKKKEVQVQLAKALMTDRDFEKAKQILGVQVMTPVEFLDYLTS